eukprot:TRINITY_DN913_c1_g1_i1.p1 TRINITY_DN913_c1_g1~~TRINITY_DN913_c1_g1_i1.p1  ORF type:complete len:460 (-),score=70.05 TRINITY_DN913_c1_g1_i1:99-1478(-)
MALQLQEDDGEPTRGYIDGCFDIMHSGHYNAIRQAKSICDVLVVGVHSDVEIAENKAVPVMKQNERYALLDHIKWIDELVYDVPYTPLLSTLEKAKADFCVHGDDMPVNSEGVCAYDPMKNAGRLRIVKRTEGVSTTDIIGRLLTMSRQARAKEWNTPNSPKGAGFRMASDAAINAIEESILPDAVGSVLSRKISGEGSPELESALKEVGLLAEKYKVSNEDANTLRAKILVAACGDLASSSPSKATGGYVTSPPPTPNNMRAKVPVQLLASTRRIREFSTSRQPGPEDKIIYVSGSFDMFHVGHAEFLKQAKELGTFLLVGIYDDNGVSRAKGPSFPVMNLNERVLNVCACKWVDEVIIGAPRQVTQDILTTWQVHLVARGTDHKRNGTETEESRAKRFQVAQELGVIRQIPSKWPELCHETVVNRIIENREIYRKRNADRAAREDAYYAQKKTVTEG